MILSVIRKEGVSPSLHLTQMYDILILGQVGALAEHFLRFPTGLSMRNH